MDYHKETINTFEKRAQLYDKHTNWVTAKECISPFLMPVFGNGRAFEACAGTGVISKALIDLKWKVISCDINKEMLKQYQLDFPIVGDIHNIPTIDSHFDLVICRQGLQYTDLKKALSELKRICCGKIVLGHITTEENDSSDFWQNYFRVASPGRKHIFKPNQLISICRDEGLNVVEKAVYRQRDFYNGPLLHLSNAEMNMLIDLIVKQDSKFHQLYSVDIEDTNNITYTNRWEFLEINR